MTRRNSIAMWCVALSLLTVAPAARATITLRNPQPLMHDRFENDPSFIGAAYDFSGVGRVDITGLGSKWVTMISPSYFLSAKHWHPANGATVKFHHTNDPGGDSEQHTVLSGVQIPDSDVWLGKLSSPVSSDVAKYPLLDLEDDHGPPRYDYSAYDGLEIFTFGLSVDWGQGTATTVRLGKNEINPGDYDSDPGASMFGEYYLFEYDNPGLGDAESYLQNGDSGGPSFHVYEGQPALTGIHWFKDDHPTRDYSGDSFLKPYVAEIQAAMIGERLSVVSNVSSDVWTWDNQAGAGDYRWATDANWIPAAPPGPTSVSMLGNGDSVTIDTAAVSAEVILNHAQLHVTDVGTLTVGDLVLVGPASELTVDGELSATTASVYGTLSGSGTLDVGLLEIFGTISAGASIGTLLAATEGAVLPVESPPQIMGVPEPTALVMLFGAGLLGIGALARRRRRSDQQCD